MHAISDDYYNEITLKFLLNEYERTKEEKKIYQILVEQISGNGQQIQKFQALNNHVKRLIQKEREIEQEFKKLAKLLNINESSLQQKIKILQISVEKLAVLKNYRIKSNVQSYDIRDSEEYFGILELEKLLNKKGKNYKFKENDELRKTSIKKRYGQVIVDKMDSQLQFSQVPCDDEDIQKENFHQQSVIQPLRNQQEHYIRLEQQRNFATYNSSNMSPYNTNDQIKSNNNNYNDYEENKYNNYTENSPQTYIKEIPVLSQFQLPPNYPFKKQNLKKNDGEYYNKKSNEQKETPRANAFRPTLEDYNHNQTDVSNVKSKRKINFIDY